MVGKNPFEGGFYPEDKQKDTIIERYASLRRGSPTIKEEVSALEIALSPGNIGESSLPERQEAQSEEQRTLEAEIGSWVRAELHEPIGRYFRHESKSNGILRSVTRYILENYGKDWQGQKSSNDHLLDLYEIALADSSYRGVIKAASKGKKHPFSKGISKTLLNIEKYLIFIGKVKAAEYHARADEPFNPAK